MVMVNHKAVAAVLQRAADLVDIGWTQHASARDIAGCAVASNSPDACAFCALGAIKLAGEKHSLHIQNAKQQLRRYLIAQGVEKLFNENYFSLVTWNDHDGQTAEQVAAALRAAADGRNRT